MLHHHYHPHLSILTAITHHSHGMVDVLPTVGVGVVAAGLVLVDATGVVKHEGGLCHGIDECVKRVTCLLTMMAVAVGFM